MRSFNDYIVCCSACRAKVKVTETRVDSGVVEGVGIVICPSCTTIIRRIQIKGYVSVVLVADHSEVTDG